jgi:hypothetical protein
MDNLFTKGLNTDSHPKYQEEGSYRFALNAVLETTQGHLPSISSEGGNQTCSTNFTGNKKIIGSVVNEHDDVILFLYDPLGQHEIGKLNSATCTYSTILVAPCLNFSDKYPINALYKLRNGCDPYVYFTDNLNTYKVLNLNDLAQYELGGSYWCPKMDFSRDYFIPCFNLYKGTNNSGIVENAGGQLEIGVYYFAVRFLDKYQNATQWTIVTRPVAIADEPYSYHGSTATVHMYDGGSNVPDSDSFVNKTNKAISFLITGTDDLFDYYQVAVIKRTSDEGEISGVDLLHAQPWINGTAAFLYTGTADQIKGSVTLDDILTPTVQIKKIAAQAFNMDKLFLANSSKAYKDYTKYQQYASKIKTEFVKVPINSDIDYKSKMASYYFGDGSLMEDEVYPFGIVYVFNTGQVSPVFYTVGRAADTDIPVNGANPYIGTGGVATDGNPWDTGIKQYGEGTVYTRRWGQISTAVQYGASLTGLPGYHESDNATYPDIPTCENLPDGYWGRDWHGNLIVPGVTKIRHHRMPGAEIRDGSGAAHAFRTGVKFSNVEYPPDEDIVGHYFVYGDRTFERRILAKGAFIPIHAASRQILDPSTISATDYVPTPPPNTGILKNLYAFISSDLLLNEKTSRGAFVKFEKIYWDANQIANNASITESALLPDQLLDQNDDYKGTVDATTQFRYFTKYANPSETNLVHGMRTDIFCPKSYPGAQEGNEVYEPLSNTTFINNSINTNFQIIRLNSGAADIQNAGGNWRGKLYYGAIYQYLDVFSNLFEVKFKRFNNCLSREGSPSTSFTMYGGDTAVSRLTMVDFNYRQTGVPVSGDSDSVTLDYDTYMLSFPTQDTLLNYGFRHGSKTKREFSYFQPKNPPTMADNHQHLRNYMKQKLYKVADKSFAYYQERYLYNKSYSFLDGIVYDYPVQFAYQYCNMCIEDHPYRVYASQTDDNESLVDKSRIILQNNYTDKIGGTTGPITDLFVNFGHLYATTTRSVYRLPVQAQTLQTDIDNVYLGTGEVFSIPPMELKNSNLAFAGQAHFSSRIQTEYGAAYIDSLAGHPLLLTDKLNDLSLTGIRNFWQENGELEYLKQFEQLTSTKFPYISHASPIGVGYKTTYDPRHKRLLVHKRDFKLLPQWTNKFVYYPTEYDLPALYTTPDKIFFNGHSFYYNPPTGTVQSIDFDNITYFENRSFTLSYSFINQHWTSFHSYLPNYLFANSNTFFTQNGYSEIYKHFDGNYQTFYGSKYPHIIDLIAFKNPKEAKVTSSIDYSALAFAKSANTLEEYPTKETYNTVIFYNSTQSTGEQPLVQPSNFQMDTFNTLSLVKKTDRQWRINNIRDLTIAPTQPIWDSSWAAKASSPFSYIDKTVNFSNIDPEKPLYESARFRDYYLGVRLFFNPTEDSKITLDLLGTQIQNRNR